MLTRTSRDAVVAVTHARLSHVRPAQLADRTAPVGDAVERVVVERDEHAVDRGVDVGLDVAVAEVDRVLKRAHGVLGEIASSALVREGNRAGMVEERPTRGHGGPVLSVVRGADGWVAVRSE
jgi:hypothetical protein